jgi:hypothetical protein
MLLVPIGSIPGADAALIRLVQGENRSESELLLACRKLIDGGRAAIGAPLHSNEVEAAVSIGRQGSESLIIVTARRMS